jgi:transketolase
MAIAARYAKSDRRVFCLTSDGDMNEGSTWEAIMFAAQEHLDNLVLILDYNKIQALGFSKDIEDLSPLATRMENFGWACREVDGHSVEELYDALSAVPFEKGKPSFVIAGGACAISGGLYRDGTTAGGVESILPVDMYVPGCPPHPAVMLEALLRLIAGSGK